MPEGNYNHETFADVLHNALRYNTMNPFSWDANEVETSSQTVGGYQFNLFQGGIYDNTYDQVANFKQDAYPLVSGDRRDWMPYDNRSVVATALIPDVFNDTFTWDTAKKEFERTGVGRDGFQTCSAICRYSPLQQGGLYSADVSAAGDNFSVGLTRPTCWDRDTQTSRTGGTSRIAPPNFVRTDGGARNKVFKDFGAEQRLDSDGVLKLFLVHTVLENGVLEQKDIKYWGTGIATLPTTQLTEANYDAGAAGTIKLIDFTMTGEGLKVVMTPAVGLVPVVITDSSLFTSAAHLLIAKAQTFKKVNQNCWALYPILQLQTQNAKIKIESWEAGGETDPDGTDEFRFDIQGEFKNFNYPRAKWENLLVEEQDQITSGASWWGKCATNPALMEQGLELDSRRDMDISNTAGWKYPTVNLDTAREAVANDWVICLEPTDTMDTKVDNAYVNRGIGVADLLGWDELATVPCSKYGTNSDSAGDAQVPPAITRMEWVVHSTYEAEQYANSLFVASQSLTHQSYNMSKSTASKILWHMPRFDNAGRQHGNLYLEPNERIYLKLNNRDTINLNSLSIEMIDKTQRPAYDLRGDTTITLHFRDAK